VVNIGLFVLGGTNLVTIVIPASVEHIGDGAFSSCPNLQSIIVSFANPFFTSISGALFTKSGNVLLKFPEGRTQLYYETPEVTTSVGSLAFSGSKVSHISLPKVARIGEVAFAESEVESISINGSSAIDEFAFGSLRANVSLIVSVQFGASLCTALGWMLSNVGYIPILRSNGVPGSVACGMYEFSEDEPQIPSVSALPIRTAFPASTVKPNAPPVTISLSSDTAIFADGIDSSYPLIVNGSGYVQIVDNEGEIADVHISNITIDSGASVVAAGLFVEDFLGLSDGASLSPGDGFNIGLSEGISILFTAQNVNTLPSLLLGQLGNDFAIVPSEIVVKIEDVSVSVSNFRRLLIGGGSFGICDEWRSKVNGLPPSINTVCDVTNSGTGARKLSDDDGDIGLFAVGVSSGNEDTGMFTVGLARTPGKYRVRASAYFLFFMSASRASGG
jgi:hypothetical protein